MTDGLDTAPGAPNVHEQLRILAAAFNEAFGSHRRFPLDASTQLARGERVSIYCGVPEEWTAALHVEQDEERGILTHTLALTTKPLPPRMREQLSAAATRCEERIHHALSQPLTSPTDKP